MRAGRRPPRLADEALVPALPIARAAWEARQSRSRDGALDQLLVVQDLDTAITQLQHRRAALPERVGLTGLEVELAGVRGREGRPSWAAGPELMATQKDLEAQIAVVDQRRIGIEQRMYAARGSSTRDLQAMDEEVRHLNQRQSQLEERRVGGHGRPGTDRRRAGPTLRAERTDRRDGSPCCGPRWRPGQAEIDEELAQAIPARAERGGRASARPWPTATRSCGRA